VDEASVSDEPMREESNALENACRLSNLWLGRHPKFSKHYEPVFRTFAHSPRPMLKSVVYAAEKAAAEWFSEARSTVFRQWNKPPVVSDFVMRFALAQGVASLRSYNQLYVSTGDVQLKNQLLSLAAGLGKIDFFCINDTTDNARVNDPRLLSVNRVLQAFFQQPSSFEISTRQQFWNLASVPKFDQNRLKHQTAA
jgi:hypothetical protein